MQESAFSQSVSLPIRYAISGLHPVKMKNFLPLVVSLTASWILPATAHPSRDRSAARDLATDQGLSAEAVCIREGGLCFVLSTHPGYVRCCHGLTCTDSHQGVGWCRDLRGHRGPRIVWDHKELYVDNKDEDSPDMSAARSVNVPQSLSAIAKDESTESD